MNLPLDVIHSIIFLIDLTTLKSYFCTYSKAITNIDMSFWKIKIQELNFISITLFTYKEYMKIYQSKYEIDKIFCIMEKEFLDYQLKYKKKGKENRMNMSINIEFGTFRNHYRNKLKHLSTLLGYIFNQSINIKSLYCTTFTVNMYVDMCNNRTDKDNNIHVRLDIYHNNPKDPANGTVEDICEKYMNMSQLIQFFYVTFYYFPFIDIRGAFDGIKDIPLFKHHLNTYIKNGIKYANKKPFYKRLELMDSYPDF